MSDIRRPTSFVLVNLTLFDMGALRGETEVPFRDPSGVPTNLFLIMGPNGAGKTTVLDAIHAGMALLAGRQHVSTGIEAVDAGEAGFQLDAVVQLDDGIKSYLRVVSIVAGKQGLLKSWTRSDLESVGADRQIALNYGRRTLSGPIEALASSDPEALSFLDAIIERLGESPGALFGQSMTLPTVLYFPSDRGIRRAQNARNIVRPETLGYAPARRFDTDGGIWSESIENLLVWFTWLGDERDVICRELVTELVFRKAKTLGAVERQTLSVPVETETGTHRLDQLSSGERQLVQLVIRIAAHMTSSTIVLIDETEQHLHTVLRRRLINILKQWAREHEGLGFVMTSHQADSMRLLAPKMVEPRLWKSGCLVKPKFAPPRG
jgi:ABC-type cobalamin/Fe3+-siderophores transport system ATPase subunit